MPQLCFSYWYGESDAARATYKSLHHAINLCRSCEVLENVRYNDIQNTVSSGHSSVVHLCLRIREFLHRITAVGYADSGLNAFLQPHKANAAIASNFGPDDAGCSNESSRQRMPLVVNSKNVVCET